MGFSTILTVHLVEKVILIIQVLSTILQVSTILQSTIAGFYCITYATSLRRNFFLIFEKNLLLLVLYCKFCNLSRIAIKAHLDANLEFQ